MLEKLKKNTWFWVILAAVIIIFILIIPFEFPYSISVQGKVISGQEWLLHKQTDGSIIVTQRNHKTDFITNFTAYQIERGDVFQFFLQEYTN